MGPTLLHGTVHSITYLYFIWIRIGLKDCLHPAWAGVQDKFSFTKEDKNFPLKRLRAKRAPREREFFFFLRAGKLILPDRPCRIAIPKSYSIASSKDANIKKIRENVEC